MMNTHVCQHVHMCVRMPLKDTCTHSGIHTHTCRTGWPPWCGRASTTKKHCSRQRKTATRTQWRAWSRRAPTPCAPMRCVCVLAWLYVCVGLELCMCVRVCVCVLCVCVCVCARARGGNRGKVERCISYMMNMCTIHDEYTCLHTYWYVCQDASQIYLHTLMHPMQYVCLQCSMYRF